MLNENTMQLLESLSQEDLFKVSKMIEKLANKRGVKPKKNIEGENFVHEIQQSSSARQNRSPDTEAGARVNLFESMDAMHEHKDDTEIDKMLNVTPPTKRGRKPNLVQASCSSCGNVDSVSPIMITDSGRYTCNACQTRGGRR